MGTDKFTDSEAENSVPKCALLSAKCSRAQPMTVLANTRPLVTHYFTFKKQVYKKSILIIPQHDLRLVERSPKTYSFVGIRVCLGWFPSLGQISETFGLGGLGGRSHPRRTTYIAAGPGPGGGELFVKFYFSQYRHRGHPPSPPPHSPTPPPSTYHLAALAYPSLNRVFLHAVPGPLHLSRPTTKFDIDRPRAYSRA